MKDLLSGVASVVWRPQWWCCKEKGAGTRLTTIPCFRLNKRNKTSSDVAIGSTITDVDEEEEECSGLQGKDIAQWGGRANLYFVLSGQADQRRCLGGCCKNESFGGRSGAGAGIRFPFGSFQHHPIPAWVLIPPALVSQP